LNHLLKCSPSSRETNRGTSWETFSLNMDAIKMVAVGTGIIVGGAAVIWVSINAALYGVLFYKLRKMKWNGHSL